MKKIFLVLILVIAIAVSASVVPRNNEEMTPTLIQFLHLPLTSQVAAEEENLIVFTNVDSTDNDGVDVYEFIYDSICGDRYINGRIYDKVEKRSYKCDIPDEEDTSFRFLGKVDGVLMFQIGSYIYYSDGKIFKKNYYDVNKISSTGNITFHNGPLQTTINAKILHNMSNSDIQRLRQEKNWYKHTSSFDKKCIDVEIDKVASAARMTCSMTYPNGNLKADKDIRSWLNKAMLNEFLSTCHSDIAKPKVKLSKHSENLELAFMDYAKQYNKWIKDEYIYGDNAGGRIAFEIEIEVRPIVENERYITYYFKANVFFDSVHGSPHAYFRTYDKKLGKFVSANTIIKKKYIKNVSSVSYGVTLDVLKGLHGGVNGVTTDFTDGYPCEKWSGNETESQRKAYGSLPLQHMAILPEGVVLSYHPYHVAGFPDGDIHVLIPFDKIKKYMTQDYYNVNNDRLDISDFLK